jgi:hypothetical protein
MNVDISWEVSPRSRFLTGALRRFGMTSLWAGSDDKSWWGGDAALKRRSSTGLFQTAWEGREIAVELS